MTQLPMWPCLLIIDGGHVVDFWLPSKPHSLGGLETASPSVTQCDRNHDRVCRYKFAYMWSRVVKKRIESLGRLA